MSQVIHVDAYLAFLGPFNIIPANCWDTGREQDDA